MQGAGIAAAVQVARHLSVIEPDVGAEHFDAVKIDIPGEGAVGQMQIDGAHACAGIDVARQHGAGDIHGNLCGFVGDQVAVKGGIFQRNGNAVRAGKGRMADDAAAVIHGQLRGFAIRHVNGITVFLGGFGDSGITHRQRVIAARAGDRHRTCQVAAAIDHNRVRFVWCGREIGNFYGIGRFGHGIGGINIAVMNADGVIILGVVEQDTACLNIAILHADIVRSRTTCVDLSFNLTTVLNINVGIASVTGIQINSAPDKITLRICGVFLIIIHPLSGTVQG